MSIIQYINEKEAIYASFPCVDDNEIDHIEVDQITKIDYKDTICNTVNHVTCEDIRSVISHSSSYDRDNDSIAINSTIQDITTKSLLDPQAFIDDFADAIYSSLEFDDSSIIKNAKKSSYGSTMDRAFKEKFIVETGKYYKVPVKIYDPNNNIVAIAQVFKIENKVITLSKGITSLPVSEIEYDSIEIIFKNIIVRISKLMDAITEDEGFKTFELKFNKIEISENNGVEIIDAPYSTSMDRAYEMLGLHLTKLNNITIEKKDEEFDSEFEFEF